MEDKITLAKELHGNSILWLLKDQFGRFIVGTRDQKVIKKGKT